MDSGAEPIETPVRIMRLIARLNIGGPARQVVLLHRELGRLGCRSRLLFGATSPGEGSFEGLLDGCAENAVRIPSFGRSISFGGDVRAFVQIVREIFAFRPDVVHTHTAKAGALGRLAAGLYNATRRRPHRCAVVHTFHGHVLHGYFGPVTSGLVRVVEKMLALMTDRIIAVSSSQAEELAAHYAVAPRGKIAVVPIGLNLDALFDLPPADNRVDPPTIRCVYVGRLVPVKDLDTLLRGFARAVGSVPTLRLAVVGDGECRADLEELSTSLGLASHVEFEGWKTNLPAIYGSSDIVVLSSINEGTPVALIEGMAAARPVIATDVGGVRDVVSSDTGCLVPARSPEALGSALVRLATDREERSRLGNAGRIVARRRFGSQRLIDDLLNVYDDLLRTRGRTMTCARRG